MISMQITPDACELMQEQSKEFETPVLVVFQRVYRGWCGTEVVNVVAPANEDMIQDKSGFDVMESEDCKYPVFLDKKLAHLWTQSKIDVAGWAAFKRLVLIEA